MNSDAAPPLARLILYVRDMRKMADFYSRYFGFEQDLSEMPGMLWLIPKKGGCALSLMQAGKGQQLGQSVVKLVFDVQDVESFRNKCLKDGLEFGPTHECEGYCYANARDPAKNLIQITSRAWRKNK